MKKIAIIYTTFLRLTLAKQTIKALCDNSCPHYSLFIGDQSPEQDQEEMINYVRAFNNKPIGITCYKLPYDCGLSHARNYLVQEAWKQGFEHCLITADSIEFNKAYNFTPIIDFLERGPRRMLVGFQLKNRIPWEYDIELDPGRCFKLSRPAGEVITEEGITYKRVEICKNLFLAKTDLLMKVRWDKELKLFEHEDWFYRVKRAQYQCYVTESISADYINFKPPEYKKMRSRMYTEFRNILLSKYKISDWVEYV